MFPVMIQWRIATFRLDRDMRLHGIETFLSCGLFSWERCRPGGKLMDQDLVPKMPARRQRSQDGAANQFSGRLVRGMLQTPNMTMVFNNTVSAQVNSVSRRFAALKKLKICVAYLTPFATFPRS